MALTFTKLAASKVAPYAQAIEAMKGPGTEKFALPVEDLGVLSDALNLGNPLAVFSSGIIATPLGSGTVKIEYNKYTDNWTAKTGYGSASYKPVEIESEIASWHTPQKLSEAMTAFDIKKGVPAVLSQRLSTNTVKFIQKAITDGFATIVATVAGNAVALPPVVGTSVQEKGAELLLEITKEATKLVKESEYSREQIAIVVAPEKFDELSFAGLIGDRTNVTFAGGQYMVATAGGYKIMSGSMFLPAQANSKDLVAVIGTFDSFIFNTDIIAANIGNIELSNDMGTYLEMTSISHLPQRSIDNKLIKVLTVA